MDQSRHKFAPPVFGIKAKRAAAVKLYQGKFAPPVFGIKAKLNRRREVAANFFNPTVPHPKNAIDLRSNFPPPV